MFFNKTKKNCKLRFYAKYKDDVPQEMDHKDIKKVFEKNGYWHVIRNDGNHYQYPRKDVMTICEYSQK